MSKWDQTFGIGERVEVRSALLWFLTRGEALAGAEVSDQHELVFEGVVVARREHDCDPFWWGYTVRTLPFGDFSTCGRSLRSAR